MYNEKEEVQSVTRDVTRDVIEGQYWYISICWNVEWNKQLIMNIKVLLNIEILFCKYGNSIVKDRHINHV